MIKRKSYIPTLYKLQDFESRQCASARKNSVVALSFTRSPMSCLPRPPYIPGLSNSLLKLVPILLDISASMVMSRGKRERFQLV